MLSDTDDILHLNNNNNNNNTSEEISATIPPATAENDHGIEDNGDEHEIHVLDAEVVGVAISSTDNTVTSGDGADFDEQQQQSYPDENMKKSANSINDELEDHIVDNAKTAEEVNNKKAGVAVEIEAGSSSDEKHDGKKTNNVEKVDEKDKDDKMQDDAEQGPSSDNWVNYDNLPAESSAAGAGVQPGAFTINQRPNGAPRMRIVEHTMSDNRLQVAELPTAVPVEVTTATSTRSVIEIVDAEPLEPLLPWYKKRIFQGFIVLVIVLVALIVGLLMYILTLQNDTSPSKSPKEDDDLGSQDGNSADAAGQGSVVDAIDSFAPSSRPPAPNVLPTEKPSSSPSIIGTGNEEHQALGDLFISTNGSKWEITTGWNEPGRSICEWYGITCTDGNVMKVELSKNNLEGTIPSSIGNLKYLKDLNLHKNQLSLTIPTELWNLKELHLLDLSDNNLSGAISTWIGNLDDVEEIKLWGNNLGSRLPSEIGKLKKMHTLDLQENEFSGPLPSEIGSLNKLMHLVLSKNSLTSTIPSSFGSLEEIRGLGLGCNSFSGTVPTFLVLLDDLDKLDIGSNNFTGILQSSDVCDALEVFAVDCENTSSCGCCTCDGNCSTFTPGASGKGSSDDLS